MGDSVLQELLVDNYFHAVFGATKSVAEELRQKTGLARTVLNRLMKLWALETQAARALPLIP